MKTLNFGKTLKRMLSVMVSVSLMTSLLPLTTGIAAAETTAQSMFTDYQPTINEVIDESGFKHPGVGLSKDNLENVRAQVRAQKEPWNTYFNEMLKSSAASKTVGSSNQGADPTKPGIDAFNSQGFNARFRDDGLKAYTQAILYVVTGDEVYRANAMRIIRIWSQMDPAKYVYFTDSHIHTGIPLSRMVTAAEILKYTSTQTPELQWTDKDTTDFTTNLITPVIETFQHTNHRFMNQHLFPLIGAMSGYIFTGNRERYNEGVEWFTVNKTAVDQGQNGAIKQLFRLVDKNALTGETVDPPVVQHVEMGRDQAHGADDITNAEILSRLLLAQGTKVDPVEGTVSTAPNAVGPYEFLNDRILDAAEFFGKFMLGYDTPWVPVAAHTDANGNPTIIYKGLSEGYRGRLINNTWELFYYYKYVKGINMEERAPHFTKLFSQRFSYGWDYVDGGGDFWLLIPPAAEAEGTKYLVKTVTEPFREIEDRYTALDSNSTTKQEGDTSYVEIKATEEGSKFALISSGTGENTIGFKIRTNGIARMELSPGINDTLTLPDTKGQWRYVTYTKSGIQFFGDIVFFKVKGAGTTVDIDHINVKAGTLLTPPVFTAGSAALQLFTYSGSEYTINYDFSATDASATDVVTYQVDNKPEGAVFNESTGAFSWKPTQAGTYSFVVGASDGTSVTTRDVTILVTNDRQSAVDAVTALYHANTIYVSSTLDHYNKAYADVMNLIPTASDDVFYQKLSDLNRAVEGLEELTPLLNDGSMNYKDMFVTSTFGIFLPYILDNVTGSWGGGTQNPLTMDFGPSFKMSANAFGLQVRESFPERMGGVTLFGSNDNENWIRLTPGLTTVTEDMQTLEVQDDLKNQQFRFLKMQMIQKTSPLFEPSEFRIFGERHETVNKLSSVSISSDQSLRYRLVAGNTVKLSFQSIEPINHVNVTIQGQPATVTSADNLNWTAAWVVDPSVSKGTVKFGINYKTAAGIDAEKTIFTTDGSSLFIADETELIRNVLDVAKLSDSNGRTQADLLNMASYLFDGNINTGTEFRLNSKGVGSYITFDFKEGGQATLSKVEIIARQDGLYGRISGTVVQGSNDNSTWTTISNGAAFTADWQTLSINGTQPYRYIRIYNGNNWFGNMNELRFHGAVDSLNKIESASISSDQSVKNRIVPGNTVKLAFKAKEEINNVNVTIQGKAATVSSTDNINFTAAATLNQGTATGTVKIAINYKLQDGTDGYPNTTITDGTTLYLVDESDLIRNVTDITNVIDSTPGRTAETSLKQANYLFDGNGGTYNDLRLDFGSGWGSYMTFDFKAGNQVTLSSVELLARQDGFYGRIGGTVVQGSNDNTTWATLTNGAAATLDWQSFAVSDTTPYRYIRIFNPNQWYGNMAELRLHGDRQFKLNLLPPSDYTKGSYYLYQQEFSRIEAEFNKPGADKMQLANQLTGVEGQLVRIPLSLYSFEENADNSFGSSAGTVTGTAAYPAGKVGQAIALNGTNSYVTLPASHPLSTYNEITLSTWVYWNGSSQWQRIFDFGTGTNQYMFLTPRSGSNTLRFAIKNGGGEQFVQTTQLAVGQWSHVAVTLGSGTAKLYVNGELKATVSGITIKPSDIKPSLNYIGKSQWPDALFNGMIDEFRVYNRVLSAEEISAIVNNTANWIDNTLLKLFIDKAAAIDASPYTAESVAKLQAVVSEAQSVLANANATQAEVDAVSATLKKTLTGLQYPVTVSLDPAEPNGLNGSYTVPVTMTLSTNGKVEYSLNGEAEWHAYTTPIVLEQDRVYVILYRSTNDAGIIGPVQTVTVNIDKIAPVSTVTISPAVPIGSNGWYTSDVTVALSVYDNSSGMSKTEYQLNDGAWTIYTGSIPVFSDGIYTVNYRSTDHAGNLEQTKTIEFKVDKTAPELSVQLDQTTIWPANHKMGTVNVAVNANDAGSGVESVILTSITCNQPDSGLGDIEGDIGTGATSFSLRAEKDRIYTITYTATDKAGNQTVKTSTVIVPHDLS